MSWKPYVSPEEHRKADLQLETQDRLTYKVSQNGIKTMPQSKEFSTGYDKIDWGGK